MKKLIHRPTQLMVLLLSVLLLTSSCRKVKDKLNEYQQAPELASLQNGLQVGSLVGYCSSIALAAFKNRTLPENVKRISKSNPEYSSAWLLYVTIDKQHPLPFNSEVGDIIIGGLGNDEGGIISILAGDVDVIDNKYEFCGIYTVPVTEFDGEVLSVFARQDIVFGVGNDTIINFSMSNPQFNLEMNRLDDSKPLDEFVAVSQNVWFINTVQQNTYNDIYDDDIYITGGGQIVQASSDQAGIGYHAIMNTRYNFDECSVSPVKGSGMVQNLLAGNAVLNSDFSHATLRFNDRCDGQIHVDASTGKWATFNGKDIVLW
ncbi:MAG: hypothetical protein MI922_27630 [Bacteroidales bacterium]|nr:hypothetical protein [Bacteroidales bacterium]